jgi:peptidyl-prolyl cis-trans isomerase C
MTGTTTQAPPPPDSTVVFRLGDTTVTVADYRQRLEMSLAGPIQQLIAQGQTPEQIRQMAESQGVRQIILDEMIQEALLVQIARQEGVGIDAQAVDEALAQQMMLASPTPEDPAAQLPPSAVQATEVALRQDIIEEQLVMKMLAEHTRADMFKSKHILVEDEATAQEVLARLQAGEDFAALASEYSQDPGSAEQGGEYGWVPRGEFVPEYEEAAFSAELNTPVIVQSDFGYHVIVVEDRQENRSFEDIEQLRNSQSAQTHYEQTFVPWYEEVRAQAEASGELVVNPEFNPTSVPLPMPDEMPLPPTLPTSVVTTTAAPAPVTVVPVTATPAAAPATVAPAAPAATATPVAAPATAAPAPVTVVPVPVTTTPVQ